MLSVGLPHPVAPPSIIQPGRRAVAEQREGRSDRAGAEGDWRSPHMNVVGAENTFAALSHAATSDFKNNHNFLSVLTERKDHAERN